jgi:ethanolamine utilization protein EutA
MTDTEEEDQGGRVFFSSAGRTLEGEDEIRLLSVGVDIGSSTSHLVFSRLLLERLDNRYVVTEREVLHESDVLLTPYAADTTIDPMALGLFIARQYALAGIDPSQIDTGALILTGVAVRRRNARAIGELFAAEAGKFVAVSAGDALETTLAAYGSGAVALSIRERARVMNVDIGGGTSKIAVCREGDVAGITAIDVGARVLCFDEDGRVSRVEEAGRRFAAELGIDVSPGAKLAPQQRSDIAERMAERLFEAMSASSLSPETAELLRLDALPPLPKPDILSFSGGVSEYIYGREPDAFGDLGPELAVAVRTRAESWGPRIEPPVQGIRATVVGASQYTIQVSGSTIYVEPRATLPLRNIPVIVPDLPLADEVLAPASLARGVEAALARLDLQEGKRPVALCFRWEGSATFARLDAFCRGIAEGLRPVLERGHPLVLVSDGDIGGLLGIHAREEARLDCPVVSIDGINLQEFDYIDIGALLEASGAVPVVIKSLVFPTSAAVGRADSAEGIEG